MEKLPLYGQKVGVSNDSQQHADSRKDERIYLGFDGGLHMCVIILDEYYFTNGESFKANGWRYVSTKPKQKSKLDELAEYLEVDADLLRDALKEVRDAE